MESSALGALHPEAAAHSAHANYGYPLKDYWKNFQILSPSTDSYPRRPRPNNAANTTPTPNNHSGHKPKRDTHQPYGVGAPLRPCTSPVSTPRRPCS